MAVGYLHEQFAPFFGEYYPNLKVFFSVEQTPLGTGGALMQAVEFLPDEAPFLLLNGDTYFNIQVEKMALLQSATKTEASIALTFMADTSRYGMVEVSEFSLITAFTEKNISGAGFVNGGVYMMRKAVLNGYAGMGSFSLEKDLLPRLAAERKISGLRCGRLFIDIGVPSDYKTAQKIFKNKSARTEHM